MMRQDPHNTYAMLSAGEPTIVDDIASAIRREILTGRLRPEQKLRVEELKATYGVSTSTLREALLLLSGDSLVQSFRQRGFRVVPASIPDLIDIFENLTIVEVEALRRSIQHGDDAWEASILSAYHMLARAEERQSALDSSESKREWEKLHVDFHMSMIAKCRSVRLIRTCMQLREQALRYRHLARVPPAKHPDLSADHLPLMQAVLRRDTMESCKILTRHFQTSKTLISESLDNRERDDRGDSTLLVSESE